VMATENYKYRFWIVLSMAAAFVLGVPIWWKSTEIYRANLPHDQIQHWYQIKPDQTPFSIELKLFIATGAGDSQKRASEIGISSQFSQRLDRLFKTSHENQSMNFQFKTTTQFIDPLENNNSDLLLERFSSSEPGKYHILLVPTSSTPSGYIYSNRLIYWEVDSKTLNSQLDQVLENVIDLLFDRIFTRPTENVMTTIPNKPAYKISFNLLQDSSGWENPIRSWPFKESQKRTTLQSYCFWFCLILFN